MKALLKNQEQLDFDLVLDVLLLVHRVRCPRFSSAAPLGAVLPGSRAAGGGFPLAPAASRASGQNAVRLINSSCVTGDVTALMRATLRLQTSQTVQAEPFSSQDGPNIPVSSVYRLSQGKTKLPNQVQPSISQFGCNLA